MIDGVEIQAPQEPHTRPLPAIAHATRPDESGVMALAKLSEADFERRLELLLRGQERLETIKKSLMVEGSDYGVVPGTPKPTLLKPGAEKLAKFFGFAPTFTFERITDADGPPIHYQTTCHLHLGSEDGPVVAIGVGSANSWQRKYRYRRGDRACPTCGNIGAIIKGKAEYGGGWICFAKKGGCGAKFADNDPQITKQQVGDVENPDPYDMDNTLLKMSKKSALVDAVLLATASSGLFTQDIEDLDAPPVDDAPPTSAPAPPKTQKPTPKPTPPAPSPLEEGPQEGNFYVQTLIKTMDDLKLSKGKVHLKARAYAKTAGFEPPNTFDAVLAWTEDQIAGFVLELEAGK